MARAHPSAARLAMPWAVRQYVNRTIDRNPLYDGRIGDVTIHLWRGGYSIEDVRLDKTTGTVPVPFFAAKRVDHTVAADKAVNGQALRAADIDLGGHL